jgi:hypothetical protein
MSREGRTKEEGILRAFFVGLRAFVVKGQAGTGQASQIRRPDGAPI